MKRKNDGPSVNGLTKRKGLLAKYSANEIRKFPFVYLIVALPLIQIIIFYFYVNLSAFAMAFKDEYGSWSFQSLERVFEAFANHKDRVGFNPWSMLKNSVYIWLAQHFFGFIFSILTAYILTKHMVGSRGFRLAYHIPSIVGGVVFAMVMKEMYARNGGIWEILNGLGVGLPEKVMRNGLLGYEGTAFPVILTQIFVLSIAGGNFIIASAYMKIPEEIFESCKLEGCGFFRETFQIAVPCVWPTLSTLIVFSLCHILTADYSLYLYSDGTGKFGMFSIGYYLYRYQVTISTAADPLPYYGYVSAFGMLITFVTLPIVLISRKILSKVQENVDF